MSQKVRATRGCESLAFVTFRLVRYGKTLEQFALGSSYEHAWEVTLTEGLAARYESSFLDASMLYTSRPFALHMGLDDRPIHPLIVLNYGLSMTVSDISESGIANLAYGPIRFPAPCFIGETIRASSVILGVRPSDRQPDRGVLHVRTIVRTTTGSIVCTYERLVLLRAAGEVEAWQLSTPASSEQLSELPDAILRRLDGLDLPIVGTHLAARPGEVWVHDVGRTIGESEHLQLTTLFRNTHPLHTDAHYCKQHSFTRRPVVYGGLVFSWACALASRDLARHLVWDLGYDNGTHPNPTAAGDTLYAASRVTARERVGRRARKLQVRLVAVKNIRPEQLDLEALFVRETDKPRNHRIPAKVFEIDRTMVVLDDSTED